jgi:predicted acetyltransferase
MGDGLWLRLVDVVASLEARRYAADGRVVFEIEDPFRPETSGTYELIAEGGAGRAARTDAEADLSGSVNVLGATYLGGTSFQQLAWAGQVVEHAAGALDRADAMFASTPAPWCVADF